MEKALRQKTGKWVKHELSSRFQIHDLLHEAGGADQAQSAVAFVCSAGGDGGGGHHRPRHLPLRLSGGEALRRRCAYLYIPYPDLDKELAILRSKAPHVDDRLAAQVAVAVQKLRSNEAILKKPSIAETLDWASALEALGVRELTPDAMRQTAGFVLKNNEDLAVLEQDEPAHECSCGHHHGCGGHHHG